MEDIIVGIVGVIIMLWVFFIAGIIGFVAPFVFLVSIAEKIF